MYSHLFELEDTLKATIKKAKGNIFECYLGLEVSYNLYEFDKKDLRACRNEEMFYVHAPYVTHLGSLREDVRHDSINVVLDLLDTLKGINSKVVINCGSGNISNFVESLNEINSNKLIIENTAGAGNQLGKNWIQLRKIYEGLDNKVGFCFSTNKAYVSGLSRLETADQIDNTFDIIENLTGDLPSLIHLNDTPSKFDSKLDRYADLGKGNIFKRRKNAVKRIFDYDIDIISQTYDNTVNEKYLSFL